MANETNDYDSRYVNSMTRKFGTLGVPAMSAFIASVLAIFLALMLVFV